MTVQKPAAVGVADHNGWALMVCVSVDTGVPAILAQRRLALLEDGLPVQPYHHETLNMQPAKAEALVRRVKASAYKHAHAGLAALRDAIAPRHRLSMLAIREPPFAELPDSVAAVHAWRPMLFAADGMLYHGAITSAAKELGIAVSLYVRGNEMADADAASGRPAGWADAMMRDVVRDAASPWTKEHRNAAAAAFAALKR
jgi:hypothetical protein